MKFIAIVCAFFCHCVLAVENDIAPSEEQIMSWYKKNSDVGISLYSQPGMVKVYLKNNELAYVTPALVSNPGRNAMFQSLLIRPKLKQAKLLDPLIAKKVLNIYDLDNDGVSEIVVWSGSSGQGSEAGTRAIVQINGWELIVLKTLPFKNNAGERGVKSNAYYNKDFTWEFIDIDNDEVLDLVEVQIEEKGRAKQDPLVSKKTMKYIFGDNSFMPCFCY